MCWAASCQQSTEPACKQGHAVCQMSAIPESDKCLCILDHLQPCLMGECLQLWRAVLILMTKMRWWLQSWGQRTRVPYLKCSRSTRTRLRSKLQRYAARFAVLPWRGNTRAALTAPLSAILGVVLQKAAELEAREEAGREEFNFGVALYERGRYAESESMLRTALDVAGTIPVQSGKSGPCALCAIFSKFFTASVPVRSREPAVNAPDALQGLSQSWAGTSRSSWRWRWLRTRRRTNA